MCSGDAFDSQRNGHIGLEAIIIVNKFKVIEQKIDNYSLASIRVIKPRILPISSACSLLKIRILSDIQQEVMSDALFIKWWLIVQSYVFLN